MENNTTKTNEPKGFLVRLDAEALHELECIAEAMQEKTKNKALNRILKDFRKMERQITDLHFELGRIEKENREYQESIKRYLNAKEAESLRLQDLRFISKP